MRQPDNITNDPLHLMDKDVISNNGVIQGRITSPVELTTDNKYMFTLRVSGGYNFLIIADDIDTVRDIKMLQGKFAKLNSDAKRIHAKPRIKFGENRYVVHYE